MAKFKNWKQIVLMRLRIGDETHAVLPNLGDNGEVLRILSLLSVEGDDGECSLNWSLLGDLGSAERRCLEKEDAIASLLISEEIFKGVQVEMVEGSEGVVERLNKLEGSAGDTEDLIDLMDDGRVRCAEKVDGEWQPQVWVMQGVLNYFSTHENTRMEGGYWDKIPLKTACWDATRFREGGVRYLPGSVVRRGAWLGAGTVVMSQAFINIGAWIGGDGVMVDTGVRVASATQVGLGVKLGAGTGLEGVLEPSGRMPTIVENKVRIGAMCEVAGIVQEGAVLASGVVMALGKKIYDEASGQVLPPLLLEVNGVEYQIPVIPAWRLAVGGTLVSPDGKSATDAVILKAGDVRERGTLRHFKRQRLMYGG